MNKLSENIISNTCKKCRKYVPISNREFCIICSQCKGCNIILLVPDDDCDTCNNHKKMSYYEYGKQIIRNNIYNKQEKCVCNLQ